MKKLYGLVLVLGIVALVDPARSSHAGALCNYCDRTYFLCIDNCNSFPYDACATDCIEGRQDCYADCQDIP